MWSHKMHQLAQRTSQRLEFGPGGLIQISVQAFCPSCLARPGDPSSLCSAKYNAAITIRHLGGHVPSAGALYFMPTPALSSSQPQPQPPSKARKSENSDSQSSQSTFLIPLLSALHWLSSLYSLSFKDLLYDSSTSYSTVKLHATVLLLDSTAKQSHCITSHHITALILVRLNLTSLTLTLKIL